MKSLFLRMRVIHIAAFLILPRNAFFFITNTLGAFLQYAIAVILIVHAIATKSIDLKHETEQIKEASQTIETIFHANYTKSEEIMEITTVLDNWGITLHKKLNEFKV